jgi:protein tyrosine phosphatase (PTP) superfamily phosphohydrolase (DUF442 family)
MNKTCAFLCLASLAFAHVALSDELSTGNAPVTTVSEAAASTSANSSSSTSKSLKEAWNASNGPVRRIVEKGVPNFGMLNDHVWRSGQPSKEGYKKLAAKGLKTVVNLRVEFPQDKDLLPKGVNYVFIPIKDNHEPTAEQAKAFVEVVSNPANWPVLVHCKGGEGRAGVMAAVVRHTFDAWDNKTIMKEVSNFRVRHLGLFKVSMDSCQQKFIKFWQETPCVLTEVVAASETEQVTAAPNLK